MRKFSTFNFQLSTRKGFTLIEILVAIAIIGVLAVASITMINPLEQIKKSRDAQRKQDLRQLQIALEAYSADTNRYPAASGQQIEGASWGSAWLPYIAKVPKDPLSTQNYRYESDTRYYRLDAKLENCKDPQIITDCPYFNYQVTSSNVAIAALPTPTPIPLPEKRVFATSSTHTGNLGGLTGANQICQGLADAVGLTGSWKAWLSILNGDAKNNILPAGDAKFVRIDGELIANNKADLLDGFIAININRDENNVELFDVPLTAWTGTKHDGTNADPDPEDNCTNWTAENGWGLVGSLNLTSFRWTYNAFVQCSSSRRLYCFEQ